MKQTRKTYNKQIQPSQLLALNAMTILVTYTLLPLLSQDDVLTQGYPPAESPTIVEGDSVQGVPLLPFDEEEEKQSEEVLREFPEVEGYAFHDFSVITATSGILSQ